jgi:NADH-quinone oxidoreductase subunit E
MKDIQTVSRELQKIDSVITQHNGKQGALLGILEQVQLLNENNYLSETALERVALRTSVPLSRIYSVVTFYSFFNLKPQGNHTITVCRGTACHTKGSKSLLGDVGLMLNCSKQIDEDEGTFTTPDNHFTVSTVACFGQCALAPVVAIDGVIHSNMTTAKLQKLVQTTASGRRTL